MAKQMEAIAGEKRLNKTDVQYKILTFGSEFKIPKGIPVSVTYCEKTYQANTHKTTTGRIDGLSALYRDSPWLEEGDIVKAVYYPATATVALRLDDIDDLTDIASSIDWGAFCLTLPFQKQLNKSDIQYGILTFGSKYNLPKGIPVTVRCGGKTYQAKTHKTTTGRIDGLSGMYRDFSLQEGGLVEAHYDGKKTVTLSLINEFYTVKRLSKTEVQYKILRLGNKFTFPKGSPITVINEGLAYHAKTHETVTGWIDGLSDLYRDFPLHERDLVEAVYYPSTSTVTIRSSGYSVHPRLVKQLSKTEVQYKILMLGSMFDYPCGSDVEVRFGGNTYRGKAHNTTVGRIDGLAELYRDLLLQLQEDSLICAEMDDFCSALDLKIL